MQLVHAIYPLNKIQVLNQFIDLEHSGCSVSLQRFNQYLRAERAAESGNCSFSSDRFFLLSLTSHKIVGEAGVILSAIGLWLQTLWNHDGPDGPSILVRPTELLTIVDVW